MCEIDNQEMRCACGARCIATVSVTFPDRHVEKFCNKSCPCYNAARKKSDFLWSKLHQRRASEDYGRRMAKEGRSMKR